MLIIHARVGERIFLTTSDGEVTIECQTIRCGDGRSVRLAFDAPKAVRIIRENAVVKTAKAAPPDHIARLDKMVADFSS